MHTHRRRRKSAMQHDSKAYRGVELVDFLFDGRRVAAAASGQDLHDDRVLGLRRVVHVYLHELYHCVLRRLRECVSASDWISK